MERGFTLPEAFLGREVLFVVPGTTTSFNPVEAFRQGTAGEPSDRRYQLVGVRCSSCGFVELYGERMV
jgi:hypothetical protein